MLRILLTDDHPILRTGMRSLLGQLDEAGVEVTEICDGKALLNHLEQDDDYDLLILDLGLPEEDGYTCLDYCRNYHVSLPVVVFSGHANMAHALASLERGAMGFLSKDYAPARIIQILRQVLAGEIFRPDDLPVSELPAPALPGDDCLMPLTGVEARLRLGGLSERQVEILMLLAQGMEAPEIATMLGLAPGTVRNHLSFGFKKLKVENRFQAIQAIQKIAREEEG